MPRRPRQCPPGHVYHVLNRGVGRMTLFDDDDDYAAFERVLMRTRERVPAVELFAYCLMPNHWHLLVRPKRAGGERKGVGRERKGVGSLNWRERASEGV